MYYFPNKFTTTLFFQDESLLCYFEKEKKTRKGKKTESQVSLLNFSHTPIYHLGSCLLSLGIGIGGIKE
jgi:hypothetical protein